jgi:hypothetical protein
MVLPTPGKHGPLFHSEPTGLHVEPGDVVQFTYATADHTITAYHPSRGFQRRIPEDATPLSSPVVGSGARGSIGSTCAACTTPTVRHTTSSEWPRVVGDLSESEVPAYEDAFDRSEGSPPLLAPLGKFLERELNGFSGSNDGCEWAWLTPKEMLDAPALDPANVQSGDGQVRFE